MLLREILSHHLRQPRSPAHTGWPRSKSRYRRRPTFACVCPLASRRHPVQPNQLQGSRSTSQQTIMTERSNNLTRRLPYSHSVDASRPIRLPSGRAICSANATDRDPRPQDGLTIPCCKSLSRETPFSTRLLMASCRRSTRLSTVSLCAAALAGTMPQAIMPPRSRNPGHILRIQRQCGCIVVGIQAEDVDSRIEQDGPIGIAAAMYALEPAQV